MGDHTLQKALLHTNSNTQPTLPFNHIAPMIVNSNKGHIFCAVSSISNVVLVQLCEQFKF